MDDNRIIIDSANFSRNLPKWATEDTLNRLERLIGNSNKESQKSLQDIVRTMRTLSNSEADLFKETQKGNKDTNAELQKIVKMMGEQASNSSSPSSSGSDSATNTREIRSDLKEINTSTQKAIKSILDGNSDVSSRLKTANETNEKVSNSLLSIFDEIKKLSAGSNSNSDSDTGSGSGSGSDSTSRIDDNRKFQQGEKSNNILEDIRDQLVKQNATTERLVSKTVPSDRMRELLNNNANRISNANRSATDSSMGSLGEMFRSASNRNSRHGRGNQSSTLISKAVRSMSGVATTLTRLLKNTHIGKMVSAGMMAYTVASKTFEYAYDVQSQFHDMVNRGFNFGEMQANRPDRVDGISTRRAITSNNVGLETATKILENNTRLINELGLDTTFTELGNIIGHPDDEGSVTNRLALTRDEVAIIASDFYGIQRRINNISREFTAIDRQRMATKFIENVRTMSQELGVGVPKIREAIEQFTNSNEFTRSSTFMRGEQSQNVSSFAGIIKSVGIDDALADMILSASTSTMGLYDASIMNSDLAKSPLFAEVLLPYSDQLKDVRNQSPEQQLEMVRSMANDVVTALERNGGSDVEGLSTNPTQRAILAQLSSFIPALQQLNSDDKIIQSSAMSPQARAVRELENLGLYVDTQKEDLFSAAADSPQGREAIMAMFKADEYMKRAQLSMIRLTKDLVEGLFSGPIPTLIRGIKRLFEQIIKAKDWLSGKRHNGTIENNYADAITHTIKERTFGEENFKKVFDETKDEDGKTVYDIKEGYDAKDVSELFSRLYDDADGRKEREYVAAAFKSISRGLEGTNSRIGSETRDIFAQAEESFLGMASMMASGEERDELVDVIEGTKRTGDLFGENFRRDVIRASLGGESVNTEDTGKDGGVANSDIIDVSVVGAEAKAARLAAEKTMKEAEEKNRRERAEQDNRDDKEGSVSDPDAGNDEGNKGDPEPDVGDGSKPDEPEEDGKDKGKDKEGKVEESYDGEPLIFADDPFEFAILPTLDRIGKYIDDATKLAKEDEVVNYGGGYKEGGDAGDTNDDKSGSDVSPDDNPDVADKGDPSTDAGRGRIGASITPPQKDKLNDDEVKQDALNNEQKTKSNEDYTKDTNAASSNTSTNIDNSEIVGGNTNINSENNEDESLPILASIVSELKVQTDSIDKNTRAIERFINRQV